MLLPTDFQGLKIWLVHTYNLMHHAPTIMASKFSIPNLKNHFGGNNWNYYPRKEP